ncbi:MAG: hypothetical protein K6F33_11205 [Bacteroidales bacterium]|nr:hypothetical protein [Bacteroidales bacterium]
MKTFFSIILLLIATTGFCQREYTHENQGFNIFGEADGVANLDYGFGGASCTAGYQFNPHFFLGGGFAMRFGNERDKNDDEVIPLGWYDADNDVYRSDYYIDNQGVRHQIIDAPDDEDDKYFYLDDEFCEGGLGGGKSMFDLYLDIRYNFLAHSRYTPYICYRTGLFVSNIDNGDFNELVLGCRFGCGEGDCAVVGGAGWSYRNAHNDEMKNQHMLILRLGVEF